MDKRSLYLFTHLKENLGLNLSMKNSTSDNSTRFKTMQIIQNQISMENFNQDSVGYNSDVELYDWDIENYET